jgi:CHAD domain-containing protein
MEYAIRAGESLNDAVRRLISEEIDRAEAHLRDETTPPDERVHGVRKRFKEIRAVLRLIRPGLGSQFETENEWYRDAGRELSRVRDARVVIGAVGRLPHDGDEISRRVIRRALRVLRARHREASRGLQATIAGTLQKLPVARDRIAGWPELDDRFSTIGHGLVATYRAGRRALGDCVENPAPEHFHEWRKRVKDHAHHLELLRNVWPAIMKVNHDAANDVARALGEHHDLTLFRQLLDDEPRRFGDDHELQWLRAVVRGRLTELERKAMGDARRLLAERPERWRKRVERYWDVWRDERDLGVGTGDATSVLSN